MILCIKWASQLALVVKNLPANTGDARDLGLITGLGRSPGEGHSKPLQCSFLESPMDRGAWWVTVHGVTKSSAQSCLTLCNPMDCSTPGLPLQSLLKSMSTESVMPSNHLILCRPFLFLPSIFPSIWVFSNESVLHIIMAKVLEFQLQHQSFQ